MTELIPLRGIVEGALLAATQPLRIEQLVQLFDEGERPSFAVIVEALAAIQAECTHRGIELVEVASGYRFQVKSLYAPWVSRLWQERSPKYSRATLETLALIAYRQPITRSEIEEIRGVSVSSTIIKSLLEREWIRVIGYREVPGRPALYATTRQFLEDMNLKSLGDLPLLPEVTNVEALTERADKSLGVELAKLVGVTPVAPEIGLLATVSVADGMAHDS